MKQFLEKIKELHNSLLKTIRAGELEISSANGIPFGSGTISFENAKNITRNVASFKEEADKFSDDDTKIVLSKRFFKNVLQYSKFFLFLHLNERTETRLLLKDADRKKITESTKYKDWLSPFIYIAIIIIASIIAIRYSFSPTNYSYVIPSGIAILICLVLSIEVIKKNASIATARTAAQDLTAVDFFRGGYDHLSSEKKIKGYNFQRVQLQLANIFDFKEIAANALALDGAIGYLIAKDYPIEHQIHPDGTCTVRYSGNFVPVLILNEAVVIDYHDAQLIFCDDDLASLVTSPLLFL